MPFYKRYVTPHHKNDKGPQHKLVVSKINGKELVENYNVDSDPVTRTSFFMIIGSLSQLQSLSKHADDLFNELESEYKHIFNRTVVIEGKLQHLQRGIVKLDHKRETIPEGSLTDFSKLTDHYRTKVSLDDRFFTSDSRPNCVQDQCEGTALDITDIQRRRDDYRKDEQCSRSGYSLITPTIRKPKIPNLELETRKPSLLERYIKEKEKPWQRTRSVDFEEFIQDCSKDVPLPTPDEQFIRNSRSQPSIVVPVDTSGQSFQRMCEHRRSLQEISLKNKRRATVSGPLCHSERHLSSSDYQSGLSFHSQLSVVENVFQSDQDIENTGLKQCNTLAYNGFSNILNDTDNHNTNGSDNFQPVNMRKKDTNMQKEEKVKRWSWKGSLRDLARMSRRDKSKNKSENSDLKSERSSSIPPGQHLAHASDAADQKAACMNRTTSQDTLQSLNSAKNGCLGFNRLRRTRSMMTKRKDKKDTVEQSKSPSQRQNISDMDYNKRNNSENNERDRSPSRGRSLTHRLSRVFSIRHRSPHKKNTTNTEERHSSSGNWSASSESVKRRSGSSGHSSEKTQSFKDSAVELQDPDQQIQLMKTVGTRSRSGSLGQDSITNSQISQKSIPVHDFREDVRTMESSKCLLSPERDINTLQQSCTLTSENLEQHNSQVLKSCDVLLEDETFSEFSIDHEGFFTSMHVDSGLISRSMPAGKSFDSVSVDTTTSTLKNDSVIVHGIKDDHDIINYKSPKAEVWNDVVNISAVDGGQPDKHQDVMDPTVRTVERKAKPAKPLPPKRTTTLLKSKSSVSLNSQSQLATVSEHDEDTNSTKMLKRYSTGSESFSSGKLTLFSASSDNSSTNSVASNISGLNVVNTESNHEAIYASVKRKTIIDSSTYPSLCNITPCPSNESSLDGRNGRKFQTNTSVVNSSGTLLLSKIPSVWSDFKSPYSTINNFLEKKKPSSSESAGTSDGYGPGNYGTLPIRLSANKQITRSISAQPSYTKPSVTMETSDRFGNMDWYNSWPRSPRNSEINSNINNMKTVVEKKDEFICDTYPNYEGRDQEKSLNHSVNYKQCSACGHIRDSGRRRTSLGSQTSLMSSLSHSTNNSSRSSGSGGTTIPDKYQQHIRVRPKNKHHLDNPSQEHIYATVVVNTANTREGASDSSTNVMRSPSSPWPSGNEHLEHDNIDSLINSRSHIYANVEIPVYANMENWLPKTKPKDTDQTWEYSGINCEPIKSIRMTPLTVTHHVRDSIADSAVPVSDYVIARSPPTHNIYTKGMNEDMSPVFFTPSNVPFKRESLPESNCSSDFICNTSTLSDSSFTTRSKPMQSFSGNVANKPSNRCYEGVTSRNNVSSDLYSYMNASKVPHKDIVLPTSYKSPPPAVPQRSSLSSKFASIRFGASRFSTDGNGTRPAQDPSKLVAEARRNSLPNAKVYCVQNTDSGQINNEQSFHSLRRPGTLDVKNIAYNTNGSEVDVSAPSKFYSLPRNTSAFQIKPYEIKESKIYSGSKAPVIKMPLGPSVLMKNRSNRKNTNSYDVATKSFPENDRVRTALAVNLTQPGDESYSKHMRKLSGIELRLESRKSANRDSVTEADETQVMTILDSIRNTIKSIATIEGDDNDSAIGSPESPSQLESNSNTM